MNTFRKMMELTSFRYTYDDLAFDEKIMNRYQNGAFFVWQYHKSGTYLFPLERSKFHALEWAESCNRTWPKAPWFLIEKNVTIREIPAEVALDMLRRALL